MKYIIGLWIVAALWACSKEDWPDNSRPEINPFAVPADATGEEADLRRDFFDRTGVYLLFSDTLITQEVSTISGKKEDVYTTVRLEWNMVSTNEGVDSFVCYPYEHLEQKKVLAEFVENEVLKNVSEIFKPYSVMLLDRFVYFKNQWGTLVPTEYSFYAGMQSTVIALGDFIVLTAEEKEILKNDLVGEMVVSKISAIPDVDWEEFYSYSEEYYELSSQWEVPYPIQACGYLPTFEYEWMIDFHSKEYDRLAFVSEIFKLSESDFRETYAEWPIIIDKMETMVKVLRKYGVKVYE